ncbi:MAG: hypothetical protein IJV56_03725, partial [Neisseriaceae bacterium]|nr:hypothetical protein [Neisseriaceae bacterium]
MRPFLKIGYPETVFKLACRSFKNCFRRLPRRAYGTARNDDIIFRLPENPKIKYTNPFYIRICKMNFPTRTVPATRMRRMRFDDFSRRLMRE